MSRSGWPIQNELIGIFENFFFHFALFWAFPPIDLLLICFDFYFCWLCVYDYWGFCFLFISFIENERQTKHKSYIGNEVGQIKRKSVLKSHTAKLMF